MSKDKISDYSATANSNTDIGGINIDEGCAPSGINDAIRTLMKQLKDWQSGSQDVYIHPAGSASVPSITATGDTNTGLFFPAADTVGITTGGTERARVDSSGNLGLGVTPSAWDSSNFKALEIPAGSLNAYQTSQINLTQNAYYTTAPTYWAYKNTAAASLYRQTGGVHSWHYAASGTAGNAITFTQAMTLSAAGGLSVGTTTDAGSGNTLITGNYQTTGASFVYSSAGGAAGAVRSGIQLDGTNNVLALYTAQNERARIDSSGNLLVGVTSPVNNERFNVTGGVTDVYQSRFRNTNTSPYGLNIQYTAAAPNGTINQFIGCGDTGADRFIVRSNGGIANYSANNVNLSDRREKTNFSPASSYLDKICAIPVQTFNYVDQNLEEDDGLTLGVVAQDVQAVAPELVTESNWGTLEEPKIRLSIYQTDLQYALMKCIQEMKTIIDQQAERITALEAK